MKFTDKENQPQIVEINHLTCARIYMHFADTKYQMVLIDRSLIVLMVSTGWMATADDILNRFGTRVRQLRKSRGLSQEAFADACKLDRSYIGGVERGERNVSLINIERISHGLEISLSHLLDGL